MSNSNKKCKICGEPSGRRNVCEACKIKYPHRSAQGGGMPFNRKYSYLKDKLKRNI